MKLFWKFFQKQVIYFRKGLFYFFVHVNSKYFLHYNILKRFTFKKDIKTDV